jgi:nucleoid-associated protein YgaU
VAEPVRIAQTVQPAAQPPIDQSPAERSYTVQSGDSLWRISGLPQIYNNPYRWPRLYITNRERLTDPNNPDLIEPGQVLQVPSPGTSRYYSVQDGDSFTSIASDPAIYNDPYQWERLYNANRDRMLNPENPHLILPGMILEIPQP